jgi:hypothetical protein
MNIDGHIYSPGDLIMCSLKHKVVFGALHIENGSLWICHNDSEFDGSPSPNRWGFRHSWVFSHIGQNLFSCDVKSIRPLSESITLKSDVTLSTELQHFIQLIENKDIGLLFHLKIKPYDMYNQYELSAKPGYIKMKGTVKTIVGFQKKSVEIKFSRFLKAVSSAVGIDSLKLTDAAIEKAHNLCIAFKQNSVFEFGFWKGKDIEKGYDNDNYSTSGNSTLHKSCMTNKFKYLKLYKKNEDVVQLAYLKSGSGLEARCLVWKIDEQFYYDRIYYSNDWIFEVMRNKLEEAGYIDIQKKLDESKVLEIKIEEYSFDDYPYVDTFKYLSKRRKKLYAAVSKCFLSKGLYHTMINTDGSTSRYDADDE